MPTSIPLFFNLTGSPFKIDLRKDEPDSRALALLNTKYFVVQNLQWYFLNMLGQFVPVDLLTLYITGCYDYLYLFPLHAYSDTSELQDGIDW